MSNARIAITSGTNGKTMVVFQGAQYTILRSPVCDIRVRRLSNGPFRIGEDTNGRRCYRWLAGEACRHETQTSVQTDEHVADDDGTPTCDSDIMGRRYWRRLGRIQRQPLQLMRGGDKKFFSASLGV